MTLIYNNVILLIIVSIALTTNQSFGVSREDMNE